MYKFQGNASKLLTAILFLGIALSPPGALAATTIGSDISTGGNLTADGALKFTSGAVANYILKTDGSGNATWISVGTSLGNSDTDSLPQGAANLYYSDASVDARISAQKGAPSGLAPLDGSSLVPMANLPAGTASGLATLDGSGLVPSSQLPAIAITNVYVAADIAARNALTVQTGDVAIVLDAGAGIGDSRSYIYDGAVWQELLDPTNLYLSKSNNLSDLTSVSTAQTNLGLGTTDSPNFAGINFTPGVPPAYSEGLVYYDSNLKSLSYYNDQSTVPVNIGQKNILRVENNSGGPITFGQVVYISGAGTGGIPAIDLARADSAATSKVLGFAAENIASGSQGYVTAYGMLTDLNTAVFTAGDPLYLSPTTAGGITATRPVQPNYEIPVGYIGKSGAADGTILAFVVPKLSTQVTPGGVPFGNTAGYLIDDSSNLFWDNTLKRLGIGTNTPGYTLDVAGDIKTGDGSLFYLGTNAGAPAGAPANGAMYYDTGTNKFRCYENGAWKDCDEASGGVDTLQSVYDGGATITTAGATDIAFTLADGDFTASGVGSVNLTPTGASSFTSAGGALTLTAGATSTWGTSAGDLNLAVNGAGTGNVQIGTGGAGSATPDLFVLDIKSDAEGAFSGTNGAMYYNASTNKFRCYQNSAWVDCVNVSSGAALSAITAAVAANSINNGDNAQTWNWDLTNNNKSGLTFGENTASTGTGTSIVNVSTLATSTAAPIYVKNLGEGDSFKVDDEAGDITPFVITKTGQVGIGTDTFDPLNEEKLKVEGVVGSGSIIGGYGDINSALYITTQNRNSGALAATAFTANANDAGTSVNYMATGITSSTFNDPTFSAAGPHDAFLFNVADFSGTTGGNMLIGTLEPAMSIKFLTGGGATPANEQMRIDGSGNVGIGTTSAGARLDIAPSPTPWVTPTADALRIEPYGAVAGNTGNFELMELAANGTNYVGLKAPDSIASDIAWTLPNADGTSGQALVTNGSAGLSWASASSNWQKVATTLSPLNGSDDVTTSGNIYTTGTGAMTSAGILTGQLGLTVTGADVSLNSGATALSNFNTSINEGTSTGTVTIGNSAAGAIGITSGAGLTLTGGATSTWGTSTGNLNLAVNGALTGNVQIGSGTPSTAPDLLVLDNKSDPEGALGGTNGAMYYNASTNKFRCYSGVAWGDCSSAALSSLTAATAANTINNGDFTQTWNWDKTTNSSPGITFGENTASTGTGTTIVNIGTLAGSTAMPLVINNAGNNNSFRVNDTSPGDTTPFIIDEDGNVAIGATSFDPTNPEKLLVDAGATSSYNVIKGSGNIDSSLNLTMQNKNAGTNALSIVAVVADNGSAATNTLAMGISSSGFNDPVNYGIAGPDTGFLVNLGSDLIVGTAYPGTNLKFITGAGFSTYGERMRLDSSGNLGIGTTAINARLDLASATADALRIEPYGAVAGNTGGLEFMELAANGSNYVGFKSPDSIAANKIWTLPNADGSAGQALTTNGSGTLAWMNPTGVWQKVGTTLSPTTAGDDVTTSGNISSSGTGTITSAGLLSGQLGLTVTGADVSLNSGITAISNFNTSINEGTSTGTVTIGNSAAGAIGVTSGAGLTLTGGATSTWGTSAGNLNLAVNGAGTGNVQIGSGTPSTAPDLLVLDNKSDAEGALAGTNGAMYYNAVSNKFRCYINGAWGDCSSAALSSLTAATADNTINNGDNAQTWNWDLTNNNKSGLTFGENTASTGTGTSIVNVSNLASSTAVPLVVNNIGAGDSFRVNDTSADTTPFLIDKDGNVAIGATSFDPLDPEKLKIESSAGGVSNVIGAYGDNNAPIYSTIKNRNSGANATAVMTATSDDGTTTTNYAAMGITSSGFSDPSYTIAGPHDAYLFNVGDFTGTQGGNMIVGTAEPGMSIKFITGGGAWAANEQMRIDSNGNVGIGTTTLNAKLDLAPATADALRIEPYGAVAGNTGGLEFMELAANGSNYVGFKAPDNIAADKIWTLPNADGTSGQMLATDGAGALSWASATGVWQRVGTTLSPTTAGDAVTSDGLLTSQLGLTVTGAAVSLNDGTSNFNTTINTGTSTGSVTIGNSAAGAVGMTSGAALTLAGGATSSFSTTAGDINLQPAGTVAGAYVQIGAGGAGSGTPAYLALDVKSTTGDPATGTDGAMYYNEFTDTFRCFINGSWSACDTTGGTLTLQSAYNGGSTINTSGTNIVFTLNGTDKFTASGAGKVELTPTGASSFTSGAALTLTGGATSTWSTSTGDLNITSAGALALLGGTASTFTTTTGDITLKPAGGVSANVQIGATGTSATPNYLVLDNGSAEPSGSNGAMYYNTSLNTFRCYVNGGWQDCGATAASATTLQQAYNAGNVITLSDGDLTVKDSGGTNTLINASGAGAVALTPTGVLTLTGGATSTWSVTGAGNDLIIDAADVLNLGTTNATGITIGKSGVTTTNIGTLQTGNAATAGNLKIADGSTNFITLTSPAIASDYTLTLPTTAGSSGQAMTTNGSGTLSWSNVMADPMTSRGDIIIRDATNTTARLAKGTAGQVLQSNGTDIAYATLTSSSVGLGNVTNDAQVKQSIGTAKGDLIAYTASNTPVRLPVGGTQNWVLTVDSGQATGIKWAANTPSANSLDFTEFKDAMTVDANTSINLANKSLTINDLVGGGAGTLSMSTNGAALTITAGAASTWSTSTGALTVDSAAGLNLGTTNATAITIGKSGITTTNIGTLQTGNAATAGNLKIADGSTNFITLTSPAIASDYTLTLPTTAGSLNQALITNGSGTLSWSTVFADPMTARGDIIIRDATNTTAKLGLGTSGQVLKSNGTDIAYATLTPTDVGLSNVTNDAQIPKAIGTAKGDMIAYTASNTPVKLPVGGTNGWVLMVDATQATGLKWAANTPANNSLDFAQFSDAMTVDANTSINLAGKSLTINDLTGGGALSMTTNAAALTLTAGAASTWSTSAGALTVDSAAGLNLGTTNATAITIGKAGVTTTNIGTLQTGNAATAGNLKIADGSTNFITLTSPSIASDYTLTLPTTAGSNGQSLRTDGSGNLSWNTPFTSPMTTEGDMIYQTGGVVSRLGVGTSGQVIRSNGTDPVYTTLTPTDVGLSNVTNDAQIPKAIGTAKGDLIAYTASNTPVRLPIGALNGYVLTVDGTQGSGMKWAAGMPAGTTNNSTIRYDTGSAAWQENTNFSVTSAGTASVAAGQSYTGAGAVILSSGAATALTITGNAASTWSTTAGALNVDSAAGLNLGTTNATGVSVGRAAGTFALASTGLNVTTGGALTGVASIDTIATSATALTFAGAGTVSSTGASTLTLDSGTTGNVNLGTGASAKNITIGNATGATNVNILAGSGNVTIGTSDTVGTLLVLDTKTGTGDPGGVNGGMYYNSGENKFKCYEAGAWKNCDSSSALGLQQAYNNGATITTAGGNAITFTTPIGSNNSGLVVNQNNTTNNPVALQITNAGTGNDITATNWSITKSGNLSTSGNVTTTGTGIMTSAGLLTGQLGLTVTGAAVSLNSGSTVASNFNTSINEGTSTGTVTIGNSVAGAISITSGSTITIGSAAATAVKIGKLGTQYGILYTSATDGTLAQTAAGTAGQFLQSNGTSAPTWASAFTPKIGQFYDSAGSTSITTGSIAIPFNQETIKDANYTHSTVTNPSQITFAVSGYYKISYNISSKDTTDSRENVQCRGRIDGTTDITPSKSYSYGRNTTDKDQTNTAIFFYNATATHYLEIVCTLSGSNYTATTNANESWATLEFIR